MGMINMKKSKIAMMLMGACMTVSAFAQDLTGTWQQIDDKTGSPKAIIEIRQENNGTYVGKIVIPHKKAVTTARLRIPINRS